jgi:outer membrane receptor protein involved in Fe transport
LQFAGYFSKAGDHENFYCPKLELDYDVYGFTHLYLLLSRDARAPSDLETNADYDTLNPYFQIDGKEDLASEYCWIQEVGLRRDQFSLGYYRFNYDDFITVIEGPANQYEYTNIDAWVITGCDAHLDVPLRFCDTDSSRTIVIVVGASGNIIFEGDSVPFTPSYRIGGHLSFTRDTRRFGFGAAIRGEVYGRNIDLQGQESPGFAVISAAGLVKFMGLSVVARINNVLDEAYAYVPYYPMPGRNYDVSVKWEFWD